MRRIAFIAALIAAAAALTLQPVALGQRQNILIAPEGFPLYVAQVEICVVSVRTPAPPQCRDLPEAVFQSEGECLDTVWQAIARTGYEIAPNGFQIAATVRCVSEYEA